MNEDDSSDKYGSYTFKSGEMTAPFSNLDNSDLEPAFWQSADFRGTPADNLSTSAWGPKHGCEKLP